MEHSICISLNLRWTSLLSNRSSEILSSEKSAFLLTSHILLLLMVPLIQKVRFVFQISQSTQKNIPKNYPELEIWNSNPYQKTTYSNSKLRIVFWNNFFVRLGDLKNESHFLKKATFKVGSSPLAYFSEIFISGKNVVFSAQ